MVCFLISTLYVCVILYQLDIYLHAAYHAMSSADARRSCHCSDYALRFDLLLLRSCCITMAASVSSPALAAPVVHAATSNLLALAAPERPPLRYTLENALQYRHKINLRPSSIGRVHEVQIQVRKKGNAAAHYYRKLFTLKNGTPLVKFLDFSHVERCKIICIELLNDPTFELGNLADFRSYWDFGRDKRAVFKWKALIAVGLTDAQLFEFFSYPIISVKFVPSRMSIQDSHAVGDVVMDTPVLVNWSWIFDREDGSWISLVPGLAGRKMIFQIAASPDHPRHTGIVRTPRRHRGDDTDHEIVASWEQAWVRSHAILFGGLEEHDWRRHMREELRSGRFGPTAEFRPYGWFRNDPIAHTIENWLLWEFEKANGNPYTQDLPPIQMPSGATAIVQPLDSAQPSLTQTPALAADIGENPGPWDMGYSSGSEEELPLNSEDAQAMRESEIWQELWAARRDGTLRVRDSRGRLVQWQERTLVTSPRGSITGWTWQGSQD